MKAAIDAVPYASAVKFGLQFKRRFWEEDEQFSAASATPICRSGRFPIRAPNFNAGGKGVLLGGYTFDGPNSYEFTAMPPAERVKRAVEFGAQIHPAISDRVRERRLGRLEPGSVHPWLRGRLVGRSAKSALQRPLSDRRPDRAGRRARLLHSGLAGGRDPVGAGRDPAPAQAGRRVMRRGRAAQHALVDCGGVGLPALAEDAPAKSAVMSHGWEFAEQGGAELFRNVCAACHQPDAKGAVGAGAYPPLADDPRPRFGRVRCSMWCCAASKACRRSEA